MEVDKVDEVVGLVEVVEAEITDDALCVVLMSDVRLAFVIVVEIEALTLGTEVGVAVDEVDDALILRTDAGDELDVGDVETELAMFLVLLVLATSLDV